MVHLTNVAGSLRNKSSRWKTFLSTSHLANKTFQRVQRTYFHDVKYQCIFPHSASRCWNCPHFSRANFNIMSDWLITLPPPVAKTVTTSYKHARSFQHHVTCIFEKRHSTIRGHLPAVLSPYCLLHLDMPDSNHHAFFICGCFSCVPHEENTQLDTQ